MQTSGTTPNDFTDPVTYVVRAADGSTKTYTVTVNAGLVSTLAGTALTTGYTDAAGTSASFSSPQGVAVDGAGNIYVADYSNHVIRMISAGVVTTFAGTGTAGSADGPAASASFRGPFGIAIDGSGVIYVADSTDNKIRKIDSGTVSTVAGTGTASFTNGTPLTATFNGPRALVVDGSGNVYVADTGNNAIRKISGGTVTTLTSLCSFPSGVAFDSNTGNLYIANTLGDNILMLSGGTLSTVAGTGATGATNGDGSVATFSGPTGIAVDGDGNLYVGDQNNHVIRKITAAGKVTTSAGLAGTSGSANGAGTAGRFNSLRGVALDFSTPTLTVIVADTSNQLIRRVQ
jgi:DNA-binding beta-propeller fold protein YncE